MRDDTVIDAGPGRSPTFEEEMQVFRRRLILGRLHDNGGNITATARDLQLSRPYLHRLLRQIGITSEDVQQICMLTTQLL